MLPLIVQRGYKMRLNIDKSIYKYDWLRTEGVSKRETKDEESSEMIPSQCRGNSCTVTVIISWCAVVKLKTHWQHRLQWVGPWEFERKYHIVWCSHTFLSLLFPCCLQFHLLSPFPSLYRVLYSLVTSVNRLVVARWFLGSSLSGVKTWLMVLCNLSFYIG